MHLKTVSIGNRLLAAFGLAKLDRVHNSLETTIGNTPLLRLHNITKDLPLGVEILVKLEAYNPGRSTKDRPTLEIIKAAERSGQLKPGATIIEATAGNTGVGLAQIAASRGYKTIFVLPDKMGQDKVDVLKAYGAEIVRTPTNVAPDSPESYNGVAARLSQEIPNAFRPNQFENLDNPKAHYLTTGPEIWRDTKRKLREWLSDLSHHYIHRRIDTLVAGVGTGGTISGAARYLKQKNPNLKVIVADPDGSILGGGKPGSWKVEGIGEDFIPKTFSPTLINDYVYVSDKEAFYAARRLAKLEGILVGGSAGVAFVAARKYALQQRSPQRIVVILPDDGRNYLKKIYNDDWLKQNGFWDDDWEADPYYWGPDTVIKTPTNNIDISNPRR